MVKAQYQFMGKMVSTMATWECVPLHCLPMPQQISGVQRHNSPKVRPRWTTDPPLVETSGREVEDQEGMWHPCVWFERASHSKEDKVEAKEGNSVMSVAKSNSNRAKATSNGIRALAMRSTNRSWAVSNPSRSLATQAGKSSRVHRKKSCHDHGHIETKLKPQFES